jgi:hypothetical protein
VETRAGGDKEYKEFRHENFSENVYSRWRWFIGREAER